MASHDPKEQASSLWRPLRAKTFRKLLLADIASDVGTFMQSVGAAWLMVSLNAGPLYIALIQTASALPFFIFALPAGAIGDIVDRRKLVLFTEVWMAAVAITLAVLTIAKAMSPLPLLIFTFALSAGDAFESPTWRAILPELVSKEDLPAAAALNGIEFNFARAIGPALAGFIIALAGVGTAFAINAASFLGVILVVARWKRQIRKRTAPAETLGGATAAAIRYVRYSPVIRTLLFRSGTIMFFASGLLALLPAIAHAVSESPTGYGLLLGFFGFGAILGAVGMQRVRGRCPPEVLVSGGIVVFALSTLTAALSQSLYALSAVMLIAGAAWIIFISLFNVLTLNHTPEWVRARVLAVSLLVVQGAAAGGSAAWGALATRTGIHVALMWVAAGTMAAAVVGLWFKLPTPTTDLTPWVHWKFPVMANEAAAVDSGTVLVTVEYEVDPEQQMRFLKAIQNFERIRRRDGAYQWGVFHDLDRPNHYLEEFLVDSWAEHLRQHERATYADREVEERVRGLIRGEPIVRHLVQPTLRR